MRERRVRETASESWSSEGGHGSSSPTSAFADEKMGAGADEEIAQGHMASW